MPRDNDDSVETLLCKIAAERNWTQDDIENDTAILKRHRLFHINDLKSLSRESWTEIELLPLVKDLLRSAIHQNKAVHDTTNQEEDGQGETSDDDDSTKKKKKKKNKKLEEPKKKNKKDKGFKSPSTLGTPVVPTILTKPTDTHSTTDAVLSDSVCLDPLTMENTLLNGDMASLHMDESDEELLSPGGTSKKSVSFSNETTIGVAASEKSKPTAEEKAEKKAKKDKKKKKEGMASMMHSSYVNCHPYPNHPLVTSQKTHRRLPPVPPNDAFLESIRNKLMMSNHHLSANELDSM